MNTKNEIISNKNFSVSIILITTLLAGTLDILAAFVNSYLRSGASPVVVLQFIASGILENSAFSGGPGTALLGLLLHFLITFIWTLIFFLVYPGIALSPKYKILVGLSYGILIWLVMNLIVLPLSNIPRISFQLMQVLIGISFIMLLVGLPISLMFYRYYKIK